MTVDKQNSISEGEGVGGDEERKRGISGKGELKQEMRHWWVLPNSALVREDTVGMRLKTYHF